VTDEPKKPKKRIGRPKLVRGEKGNYNVSRAEQSKRVVRKRIKAAKNVERKAKKRLDQLNDKQANIKHANTLLKKGGLAVEENVKKLPKSVRAALHNDTQILFNPNAGPQTDFLAAPEKEVLYGGAAGGGKSFAMLMDLLRYAHNGNHRALLLRRTLAELTELIDQSRKIYPQAFPGAIFREAKSTWSFPSGATAFFSYVDKDTDVTRYQGQAFTWIGIDELGHYPTPYVWNYLRSRLRTTDSTIDTYMRASANPRRKRGMVDKENVHRPFSA